MTSPDRGATGPSRRVLVVEDHDSASRALARLLEAHGFAVAVASTGLSALDALAAGPPFDFLLTDLQLPDLDGLAIAAQAKQLETPPRVALITGWDTEFGPGEANRSGIDWVFSKPLDIAALIATLQSAPEVGDEPSENRPDPGEERLERNARIG